MKKIILSLFILCFTVGCGSKGVEVDLIPAGNRAPANEFTASYLNTSDIKGLASVKGKVVILDFWATWCGPCRMEIPGLVRLYQQFRGKGLEVVGLSVEVNDNRPKEYFDKFMSENQITYPMGLATMDTLRNYGVNPIPSTFFLDKNGKVALSFVGVHPEGEFLSAVEKLLAEK